MLVPRDKLHDVPIVHPLGDHRKPVFAYRHSKQWQDVRMPEMFPRDALPAKALRSIQSYTCSDADRRLTLRITSRSLVTYTRTTLMATRRPWYIPCDTSAKPPCSTSTESFEQSGMCIELGITRCRLHVLQSLLSNLSRSRSDVLRSSRRCSSC